MKTIQKLTLGLLAVIATSNSTFASNLIMQVDNSDIATNSGIITGTAQKIGAGTLVMSGANGSSLTSLEIDAGLVQFASTGNAGAQVNFGSAAGTTAGNLEVLAATVDTNGDGIKDIVVANSVSLPAHVMVQSAQLKVGYGLTASLSSLTDTLTASQRTAGITRTLTVVAQTAADVAANGLSVGSAQPGVVLATADMSASTTCLAVNSSATVQVGGAGASKLTSGLHTINGILELLSGASTGCVPGQTAIQSGGILKVNAGITVPASDWSTDLFGVGTADTLQFNSGSTLKLGNGASWARNITVGTAS